MRKSIASVALALSLFGGMSAPAFAQTGSGQEAQTTQTTNEDDSSKLGLLGLIGLVGLAGLARRDRDRYSDRDTTSRR